MAALLLAGCQHTVKPQQDAEATDRFPLRILHINDHHSRLDADSGQRLVIDGVATEVSLGGFTRLTSAFRALSESAPHVLRLHAGDVMSGDLYHTLFDGEADADLMNQICFDALVVGNHEFDHGDAGLKRFLDFLHKPFWNCRTAVLGSNVGPALGESPLLRVEPAAYLQSRVVLERGGRRIGVVGLVAAEATRIASSPLPSTRFEDERDSAQREIDTLRAEGIDIIVVLSHVGYARELLLAEQLSGVDVVVGGHSHSALGDGLAALGVPVDGPYPSERRNRDGDRVCVVQAWQYGWAVGMLDLTFDQAGRLQRCEGQARLIVGDDLRRNGTPLTGVEREQALTAIAATPELGLYPPDPQAERVLAWYSKEKQAQSTRVVAQAPRDLCLRRAPGPYDRGRDGRPGCAESTDAHGGDVQALVVSSALHAAQAFGGADFALHNGGGVRSSIAAGDFSVGDAFNILPFRNHLVILELSGAELLATLHSAIDFLAEDPHTHTGSFPYAAGLRWTIDLSANAGERLAEVEWLRDGRFEPIDPSARYRLVTNDFLAMGRDGYAPLGQIDDTHRFETSRDMAQALIDHVEARGQVLAPPPAERSTRRLRDHEGRDWPSPTQPH